MGTGDDGKVPAPSIVFHVLRAATVGPGPLLVPGFHYATSEEQAPASLQYSEFGHDFGQCQHVNGHLTAVRFVL